MIKKNRTFLGTFIISSLFLCQVHANSLQNNVGIRINPITIVFGGVKAEVPIKINQHLAITPTLAYQVPHPIGLSDKELGGGVRLDWHFNEVYREGGYISLEASYADFERSLEDNDKTYRTARNGWMAGVVLGYQWKKNRHVTYNVGLGLGYSTIDELHFVADDGEELESPLPFPPHLAIGGDFSLGWAF